MKFRSFDTEPLGKLGGELVEPLRTPKCRTSNVTPNVFIMAILVLFLLTPTLHTDTPALTPRSSIKDTQTEATRSDTQKVNPESFRGSGDSKEEPTQKTELEEPPRKELSVGQWVKYSVERYSKITEDAQPHDQSRAEFVISLVNKESIDEHEYFWVEFLINEGKDQQRVVKFLVDETGKPFPHKLILKYGSLQAVEIELRRWAVRTRLPTETLFDEMTQGLNIIPFTRTIHPWEKVTKEKALVTLKGKETEFDCLKISYSVPALPIYRDDGGEESESFDTELKTPNVCQTSGSIWYSDKIPLAGLVKFFLIEGEFRTLFRLTDYGSASHPPLRSNPSPFRSGFEIAKDGPHGQGRTETTKKLDFQPEKLKE